MEATFSDYPIVAAASGMVECKSVEVVSPLRKQDGQRGFLVDRGVGSPRHARSSSATIITSGDLNLDSEVKVGVCLLKTEFCWICSLVYR